MSAHPELIEECEVCGGPLDSNEPGHYKSPDERFRHARCHEDGVPPERPITDLSRDQPSKTCLNRQFNCGHYAYGPPRELPDNCPDCGDPAV